VSANKALSPTLLVKGNQFKLSVPFESITQLPVRKEVRRVMSVDLGINCTATCAIVDADGTVVARRFLHPAADIDRRDKGLAAVSRKASLTMGESGKLSEGFCRGIYRKVGCRNRDMSNRLAGKLVKFAREHGAEAIVFEYLKHYRPKAGGRSGSTLRQRFHGWLHRALVKKVKEMTAEAEIRTEFVAPAGTSMYAYDGSGLLWRDQKNRTLVVFANGKHYNADLIAAYNIGARFLFRVLHPGLRIETGCAWGKSSPAQPRIPVTLSTLCAA